MSKFCFLLLTLTICAPLPLLAQSTSFTAAQRAEGEALLKVAAKSIARTEREPGTGKFRSVFIQKRVTKDGREPVGLCGEINGKNAYGGYTGFQPFTLIGEDVEVGTTLGLSVAYLCGNNNPIIDTRDYTPEITAAYKAEVGE